MHTSNVDVIPSQTPPLAVHSFKRMAQKTLYQGTILIRGKNVGFVEIPTEIEDILIPTQSLNFALNGDLVEIELKKKIPGKRQEGVVTRIIEPKARELVGTIDKKAGYYRLISDDRRIHIRPILKDATKTHEGMKLVVRIKTWKHPLEDPVGEIIEVLGPQGDHETEMQAIIRSSGITTNFPKEVHEAAQILYKKHTEFFERAIQDTQGENSKRRDMRDCLTFTIDPKDAKDFDDALSYRSLGNDTHEIGIHIADVSHYVKENDPIDREACERGTSVYLVDRVIPMLPEILSNDLCSLRPHQDRLSFSVVFTIKGNAAITDTWYGKTIIHSDKRFSYEEAQKVLDIKSGEHYKALKTLMAISRVIRKKRYKEGALSFDQSEVAFEIDTYGKPIKAYVKKRTETMLMIEDFMLLTNKSVSEHIYRLCKDKKKKEVFVYRVHDTPDTEKIEELAIFLRALGYELKVHKGLVEAKDINKLLKDVEGAPEENLIKTATIRSMAKAIYTTKNIGHFGLAFKYYTHFTSPIRRYPDLMVHRLLLRHLSGSAIGGKELAKYEKHAIKSSEREISAIAAERESVKFKQVEFMKNKVGQTFDGLITGVADWGIYVEENNTKAEGIVALSSLKDDFYQHEAGKYRVRGQKKGTIYRLGDEVTIKLIRANVDERKLEFELI